MKERVEDVRQQRETAARGRDRRLWPTVAIVGYTNAGKSTLLNALVGSEVAKAEDKLFATLDPTSRQVKLGDGQTAIVTDTVGFIHKLPHQLVDAFRATLEEVNRADVLIEVVDASDAARDRAPGDRPDGARRARRRRQAPRSSPSTRRTCSTGAAGRIRRRRRRSAGSVLVSRPHGLRPRHAAGRDRRAAGVALGGRRRRRAVRGRRAAGPRPRARHGGARVRRTGRARPRTRRTGPRRRARGGGRALGCDARRDGHRRRDGTATRRGGTVVTARRERLVWTVAEGRRGGRWREVHR